MKSDMFYCECPLHSPRSFLVFYISVHGFALVELRLQELFSISPGLYIFNVNVLLWLDTDIISM